MKGQFYPQVDDASCTNCGMCLKVCPGFQIDPFDLRNLETLDGFYDNPQQSCYTAFCNNSEIRANSTSGGIVTAILSELIVKNIYDSAFVLDFERFDHNPARLISVNTHADIFKSAKSKYVPSSVYNVIKTLLNEKESKHIVTALPCQIFGIIKFMKLNNIPEDRLLFMGLFCDLNLNYNFITFLEKQYAPQNDSALTIEYRTKEKDGWPGKMKLSFSSGQELWVDHRKRMRLKKYFQLNRCLLCVDKLNRLADISVGDCYIEREEDKKGKSSVISRTQKGQEIIDICATLLDVVPVEMEAIQSSQNIDLKKRNFEFMKYFWNSIHPDKKNFVNRDIHKQYNRKYRRIKLGSRGNYRIIKLILAWSQFKAHLKSSLRKIVALLSLVDAIVRDICSHWIPNYPKVKPQGNNIVIVGGNTMNKGAEAMLFTTVDQMKKRFPSDEIYVFSTYDYNLNRKNKDIFKYKVIPWELASKIKILNSWGRRLMNSEGLGKVEKRVPEILRNARCIIDISGYQLSSQWGHMTAFNYLLNIIVARRYLIPFFILPQSLGPFDFSLKAKCFLLPLMWLYLKYPQIVFAREQAGYKLLRNRFRSDVQKRRDIVLLSNGYNRHNIFKSARDGKPPVIKKGSVGITLNTRVFERYSVERLEHFYCKSIEQILNEKKNVYIFAHSIEDHSLCNRLIRKSNQFQNVNILMNEYGAYEIENIIAKFDFIIASRYHAIIHAYKKGVPAIVLGWAEKYRELLNDFEQTDYLLDIRGKVSENQFLSVTPRMMNNYMFERNKILYRVSKINAECVYDEVVKNLEAHLSDFNREIVGAT
jgi:colanic acid/amylovoran biosynthesis protein